MNDFKFEELKDEILEFAIEKSEGATVLTIRIVSIDELIKKYEYAYDSDVFTRASNEIISHSPHIVKPYNTKEGILSANSFTRSFLDMGGFKTLHHNKIVEQQKESRKKEFDFRITKFQAKTQWLPLIVSIISLIISGISLYYALFFGE